MRAGIGPLARAILPIVVMAWSACGTSPAESPDDGVSPQTGTVADYEGHLYKTVKIGDQWWTAENLRTSHAADGSSLEGVVAYANNEGNVVGCGRLYEYQAALSAAPTGWHLPTEDEWNVLESALGANAGTRIREGGDSGFDAKYCGYRNRLGDFESMGEWGSFWSSTLFISDHGHIRNVTAGETALNHWGSSIYSALSVRYVKD